MDKSAAITLAQLINGIKTGGRFLSRNLGTSRYKDIKAGMGLRSVAEATHRANEAARIAATPPSMAYNPVLDAQHRAQKIAELKDIIAARKMVVGDEVRAVPTMLAHVGLGTGVAMYGANALGSSSPVSNETRAAMDKALSAVPQVDYSGDYKAPGGPAGGGAASTGDTPKVEGEGFPWGKAVGGAAIAGIPLAAFAYMVQQKKKQRLAGKKDEDTNG